MLHVQEIPLSKLVASAANMRKTNRSEGVKELAASIKAHGLLQNLTVRKGSGATKGHYEVIAGGRRLAALQRLAKKKDLAISARIPCHVIEDGAEEISLAENFFQCPPHPADQYEAFAKLHREQEMPVADIAARFGVSEMVVKQRLKLGGVSAKLIKAYRAGEMTLDQLTAFTITDDRKAQERVWKELPRHCRQREDILEALTETQVPSDDRRARYVGRDAYQAAGGAIIRDLFDEQSEGYFTDAGLLNRLAREKLQRHARKIVGEGWKWVSVDLDFDHGLASTMRRIGPTLGPEEQEKMEDMLARRTDMYEAADEEREIEGDLDALEQEIAALNDRCSYLPDDIARAGAFVSLDSEGHPRVERGYLRAEDRKVEAPSPDEPGETEDAPPTPKLLSEKLVSELTAARTMALRFELGERPDVALIAATHTLALSIFYFCEDEGCLDYVFRSTSLLNIDAALSESKDGRAIAARHEAWAKRMPEDAAALWDMVAALSHDDRMALFAHCIAASVNAVQNGKRPVTTADPLARALNLDMAAHWQPTVGNYLGRVSKERVLEAVREGASEEAADNIASLKKQAMVEAAAHRLEGKGWLPPVLRG